MDNLELINKHRTRMGLPPYNKNYAFVNESERGSKFSPKLAEKLIEKLGRSRDQKTQNAVYYNMQRLDFATAAPITKWDTSFIIGDIKKSFFMTLSNYKKLKNTYSLFKSYIVMDNNVIAEFSNEQAGRKTDFYVLWANPDITGGNYRNGSDPQKMVDAFVDINMGSQHDFFILGTVFFT